MELEFNHLSKEKIDEIKGLAIPAKVIMKYGAAGFREDDGTLRFSLTREHLENLYKEIEDFVADIKWQEYETYKEHIQAFQTLLHHHINSPLTPKSEINGIE